MVELAEMERQASVRSSARWFEKQGAHELVKCPTQVDEMNTTRKVLLSGGRLVGVFVDDDN